MNALKRTDGSNNGKRDLRLYANPRFYEIAFSFRNIPHEVDVFEESIRRYSLIPVTRCLEIGCGPVPHLEELAGRGYEYMGIDISPEMVAYARSKASRLHVSAEIILADMIEFQIETPADFAFILLGSLCVSSTDEFISHFDCMSRNLKAGGLYFLDWCVQFAPISDRTETWEMGKGSETVVTTYGTKVLDYAEQMYEETLSVRVNDRGKRLTLHDRCIKRAIYPQEFLLFIAQHPGFEFIGWWNTWDLSRPLSGSEQVDRPIIIIRRT